jgi:hypothetical protein
MTSNNHAGKSSNKNVKISPYQASSCAKRHEVKDRGKYVRNI